METHDTSAKNAMKLFVWTDFSPDYTSGLAFAIAKDETEARAQIVKECGYNPDTWGKLKVHRLDRRIARYVTGGG